MDKMNFRVLGALSIKDEGSVEFSLPRKHKAVLTALALAGPAGLSREKLVDLFLAGSGRKARPDQFAPNIDGDPQEFGTVSTLSSGEIGTDHDRSRNDRG